MTTQPGATTPLWVAARTLLARRGDDFEQRLATVLQSFDPEAIHDLRVSSRRMREGLALFAPCYPPAPLAQLGKKIRHVTRLLGEIRNRDEALQFFTALHSNNNSCGHAYADELDRFLTVNRMLRMNDVARLKAELQKIELRNQYQRVVRFPCLFTSPASVDPFVPLADFARSTLCTRLGDVLQLVPAARDETDSTAQHQLRIAIKHFRYRLELLSFLLGNSYRKIYTSVKRYQELLGTMHDLDVFAAISRENSFSPPVAAIIDTEIAAQRSKLFTSFTAMLTHAPLENIGETIRSRL